MNIVMTYIDYNSASVEEREIFSCTQDNLEPIYNNLKNDDVLGAVLIATCNRTELYLSLREGADVDPTESLISSIGLEYGRYSHLFRVLRNDKAIRHLCLLASGAESQLWGDTQIISQVRDAIKTSRKHKAADPVLNVMFRDAVSCGKKIRTDVDLYIHDDSTVDQAVRRVIDEGNISTALVVGNGTIGRAVAASLQSKGIETLMTLRQYHHGESIVPYGVEAVKYDDRYAHMESCDAVICATASPHCVLKYEEARKLSRMPHLMIDMAVPRDIEPSIGELPGVTLEDIDDISRGHDQELREEQISKAQIYINKYIADFHHWYDYRGYLEMDRRYFPMFVDSDGLEVLVIGGGTIAERRVRTLLNFQFDITLVSPYITQELYEHYENDKIRWIKEKFDPETDMSPYAFILACTDDRRVNHLISEKADSAGKFVSVCDDQWESDMWFPAIAMNDELTIGIIGSGKQHGLVKRAAAGIRKLIEGKDYK